MKNYLLIEILDKSERKIHLTESENKYVSEFDKILEIDWGHILSNYSSLALVTNEPLNQSDILNKFNDCICTLERNGIIKCPTWGLCGISQNSNKSTIVLSDNNKTRYTRLFIEYCI